VATADRTEEDAAPRSHGARLRGDGGYVSDVPLPVILAVGVLIVTVAVLAIRLASGSSLDESKPPVLVLGDSITDHGQRELRDSLGPIYSLSVEGQDNFRVDDLLPVASRWATRDFDQVVVNLGTNDVMQGWPMDQTEAGMQKLVGLFPNADCIHLTTLSELFPERSASVRPDAATFNRAIQDMSTADPRIRIVDWNAIVVDQAAKGVDVTSDGVHPTKDGQRLLVTAYERSMASCRT
jgi:hypothetical protein